MLNIIDVVRCFIHHQGYSQRGISFIHNRTGFAQCLVSEERINAVSPVIDQAIKAALQEPVLLPIIFIKERSGLKIWFNDSCLANFAGEVSYLSPCLAKTELLRFGRPLHSIEDVQAYSEYRMGDARWQWRWSRDCATSNSTNSTVMVYPIDEIESSLDSNPHSKKVFFPFLSSEIDAVLNSLRKDQVSVLIADDSPSSLGVTAAILQSLGANVCTAKDGLEALSYAMTKHFDVLILDEKMPQLYGSDVFEQIKVSGPNINSARLILSGVTSPNAATKMAKKGVDGLLCKPVTKTMLKSTMGSLMLKRKSFQLTPL
ncbi:response regulator [Alteromonas hispanica]|uniref:Response regulator n=1 Tax=Alteromonas hispanica TaxID=315421 RepID=A0A6L9MQH7_9ALTE|nr:response regulator [Alteromonas hispanica]NDW20494.1 response regulator [Alteromonas hispanica]